MDKPSLEAVSCHGPRQQPARGGAVTVALVGMPNTGKSTLYNRLTGGDAQIANWPGLTVDLLRGRLPNGPDGRPWELVDLPGIHDLAGRSDDEAIVLRFLTETPPQGVLLVLNASHITSQLRLVMELRQLGLPLVLALNMSDEAERFGIRIDTEELSRRLGLPVLAISARQRRGLADLMRTLRTCFDPGLMAVEPGQAATPVGPVAWRAGAGSPSPAELKALLDGCVQLPEQPRNRHSRRVDRWLLHPLVGPLVFLLIVMLMFQAIYTIGAPVQEAFGFGFDSVRNGLLSPILQALPLPQLLRSFLLDGVWLGISTVMSFLPIIFLFYLVMAIVEDSGYLPRAAFLMDGFMHWLGLDGRSFVLQVMGFGCNVPAIMGTRIIRDRSMRLLAMLVIPFALCQARLTVFIFMAAVFFPKPWWAPGLVVFSFYVLSFVAAIITGLIFKRAYPNREAFVLELPPYRRPSLGTMLRRARQEVINFLFTTRTFIILGASLVWLLTHLPPGSVEGATPSIAAWIGSWFHPLLGPIGMSPDLTVALFFGFIAKEILLGAMAVIYRTSETGLGPVMHAAITPLQALSFMTFTLLYTPCLSTVAVQIREARSRAFALRSIAWSLSLAWLAALLVYQVGLRLS